MSNITTLSNLLVATTYTSESRSNKRTDLREVSLNEVSHHDSIDDCWIIVYDRVYNVTDFLTEHPGGYEVLLEYAGRDATIAFRGTGHSTFAIKSLQSFLVGHLPSNESIFRCAGGNKLSDIPN